MDFFWIMTANNANGRAVQALMHFYVFVATATTDANMKVVYGFPMNTYSARAKTDTWSRNNGALALSTGMKLYIKAGDQPVSDYMGFFVPRMIPFFKATGGNEIDVVVNSARKVQCWAWGSYQGESWIQKDGYVGKTYFAGTAYYGLIQFKGANLIICKVGTAAGTSGTGDIVIIPATQNQPVGNNANNPLPLSANQDPFGSCRESAAAATANDKNPPIIGGSDEYIGTMSHISDASFTYGNIMQKTDIEGKTDKVAIPAAISDLTDNTSNRLFDITPKTNPTTTWIIGSAKLDAVL
jgi:hypothetical protein